MQCQITTPITQSKLIDKVDESAAIVLQDLGDVSDLNAQIARSAARFRGSVQACASKFWVPSRAIFLGYPLECERCV